MKIFTEEDRINWQAMVGHPVYKPSGKPFKSGSKVETPRMVVKHDYTDHQAFLFDDGSKVECFRCKKFDQGEVN